VLRWLRHTAKALVTTAPGQQEVEARLETAVAERAQAIADRDAVLGQWTHFLGTLQGDRHDAIKCDPVPFQCNVCGTFNLVAARQIGREIPSCRSCGSTVRFRSIVHLLSLATYGRSMVLPEFPPNDSVSGAGLSDWIGYANRLATKFRYQNTFFHQEPMLDILRPPQNMLATLDFLISTEVFEHVPPPAFRAFEGAFELLKPGGYLILTVPYSLDAETQEHYPELDDFAVAQVGESHCLVYKKRDGEIVLDTKPVFHGGPGQTLEMRVFCKGRLIESLSAAGFVDTLFLSDAVPAFGLYFPETWSLPILARKPLS